MPVQTPKTLVAAVLAALLIGPAAPAALAQAPLAAPAQALSAAPAETDDAHALARAFLDKLDMTAMMHGITGGLRVVMVNAFKQMGAVDAQAAEITDTYMMPEFQARMPELIQRFEGVLVQDFTVAELHAILNGENNDARRSAAAKAGQLPAHFQAAGQEWGAQVGRDVQMKNPDAFKGLSVGGKPPGQ